jgi:hypothetical protein
MDGELPSRVEADSAQLKATRAEAVEALRSVLELGGGVRHPVGDERADVGQVVQTDALGRTLLGRDDPQLAPR